MGQVSAETWVQLALWFSVLLGLIVLAALIVQRVRGPSDGGASPSDLMTEFQDMRERGDLSDADYKKVKTVLGARLAPRGKDSPQPP
jgi:uncharacterized membrane protein